MTQVFSQAVRNSLYTLALACAALAFAVPVKARARVDDACQTGKICDSQDQKGKCRASSEEELGPCWCGIGPDGYYGDHDDRCNAVPDR